MLSKEVVGISERSVWHRAQAQRASNRHCFLADVGEPLRDELNEQEAYHLIGNISESGAKSLLFSGGEPLVREDLIEVAKHASNERFPPSSSGREAHLADDIQSQSLPRYFRAPSGQPSAQQKQEMHLSLSIVGKGSSFIALA